MEVWAETSRAMGDERNAHHYNKAPRTEPAPAVVVTVGTGF